MKARTRIAACLLCAVMALCCGCNPLQGLIPPPETSTPETSPNPTARSTRKPSNSAEAGNAEISGARAAAGALANAAARKESLAPNEGAHTPEPQGSTIALDPGHIELPVGAGAELDAKTSPANQKLTWKSSDPRVVTVDGSGGIDALSEGEATITVHLAVDASVSAVCSVVVRKDGNIVVWNERPPELPDATDLTDPADTGKADADPKPLDPEQQRKLEEDAPIEVEVPYDEEGNIKKPAPKPKIIDVRTKEYVWTIRSTGTTYMKTTNPESFNSHIIFNFFAQKEKAGGPLGLYKATGYLWEEADTAAYNQKNGVILKMVFGSDFKSDFTLGPRAADSKSIPGHCWAEGVCDIEWHGDEIEGYIISDGIKSGLAQYPWVEPIAISIRVYAGNYVTLSFTRVGKQETAIFNGKLTKQVKLK